MERLPGPRGFLPRTLTHPPPAALARDRPARRPAPVAVRGAASPALALRPRAAAGLSLYTATFELETVSS